MLLLVGLFLIGFAGNAEAAGNPYFPQEQSDCIISSNHECIFDNPQQLVIKGKFTNKSPKSCLIEAYISQPPQGDLYLGELYILGADTLEDIGIPSIDGSSLKFSTTDPYCSVLAEIPGGVVRSGEPTEYGYPNYDESKTLPSSMGPLLKDTDIPGYDEGKNKTETAEECRSLCQDSDSCCAMTFNVHSHACYLKWYISKKAANPDGVSAIKESCQ